MMMIIMIKTIIAVTQSILKLGPPDFDDVDNDEKMMPMELQTLGLVIMYFFMYPLPDLPEQPLDFDCMNEIGNHSRI